jgi:hypothetical protein
MPAIGRLCLVDFFRHSLLRVAFPTVAAEIRTGARDPEPTVEKMKAAIHRKRGKTKAAIQNAK